MKSKMITAFVILFVFAAIAFAARPRIMTAFPNGLWIAPQANTATYADGAGDIYTSDDIEVGDDLYVIDDATVSGDLSLTGTFTNSSERSFNLALTEAFLDGTGIIGNDGTTAPGVGETDNIPAIVYASSAETTKCQWTFRVPDYYSSGLGFRILMSSDNATSVGQSIDWQLWVNDDATTFDAAAIAQDAVSPTSSALDASNEVITLTIDATGEAALSSGSYVTVDIWNAGTSDNTTEIKGIQAYYTATK